MQNARSKDLNLVIRKKVYDLKRKTKFLVSSFKK